MVLLSCVGQMVLMSTLLVLTTSSLPNPRREEDDGVFQSEISVNSPESCIHALLGKQLSRSGGSRDEERRQLGDIEFSNRYADYLRAKAKHSSLCAFLHRMQAIKRSGLGGEEEKINELLTQYRCPGSFTLTSDL